ncbi:MAG: L-lactate dehydrogenase complex protein LldF [Archaeoglobi archaeon]|nr:lactate utilization protein [Candidatus Mnemosynella bozhongmuii]MDI3502274.1 L-lactate dehydrogenase complex protein LldF [Archaeoglobi archaeon]MDK2781394.1 L-lactate dehydrogenase complex protein LldF [Archaeoglobi archaeon]
MSWNAEESKKSYERLLEKLRVDRGEEDKIRSILQALNLFNSRKDRVFREVEDLEDLRERIRKAKKEVLENLDYYIEMAAKKMEENLCKVYFAKDSEEARKIVEEILGDSKLVVKSKSNACREIGIVEYLESRGIEVVETDLADRVVQLLGEEECHPVVPAIHISKERWAEVFSRETGREVPPDAQAITDASREGVRRAILNADAGITGANAIVAETGTIITVENEGNISLVSRIPPKHIVIAGINKIVPTLEDGLNVAEATTLFGTGQRFGTYVNFITGPSKTVDVGLETTVGLHGAQEVHVILLDNGRRKALEEGLEEMLYCLNCGSCLASCPVYMTLGEKYSCGYFGGIGMSFGSYIFGVRRAFLEGLNFCTDCGACSEKCPARISSNEIVRELRRRAWEEFGLLLPPHMRIRENILRTGNPFGEPPEKRGEWMKS